MTDPLDELRAELYDAARRLADERRASRRRRRRWIIGGLVVPGILLSGTAAARFAGIVDLGSGTTPEGDSYSIELGRQTEGGPLKLRANGQICQRITFSRADGPNATTLSCVGPAGRPSQPLEAVVVAAPHGRWLVSVTVAENVKRVAVTDADDIKLHGVDGTDRRAGSVITKARSVEVTAYDDKGAIVGTATGGNP